MYLYNISYIIKKIIQYNDIMKLNLRLYDSFENSAQPNIFTLIDKHELRVPYMWNSIHKL